MTTVTKKPSKTATKAKAAKPVKTEAKAEAKERTIVYRERSNRVHPGQKSQLGDRKIIYTGVLNVKGNEATEFDGKTAMSLDADRAQKVMNGMLKTGKLVGARLYPRSEGKRAVWVAFAKDNPGLPVVTA